MKLFGFIIDEPGSLFHAVRRLPLIFCHQRNQASARILPVLPIEGRLKDRAQPVVIALRNRVVTMVVALRALDRQSEQGGRYDLDGIRDDLVAREINVGGAVAGWIW